VEGEPVGGEQPQLHRLVRRQHRDAADARAARAQVEEATRLDAVLRAHLDRQIAAQPGVPPGVRGGGEDRARIEEVDPGAAAFERVDHLAVEEPRSGAVVEAELEADRSAGQHAELFVAVEEEPATSRIAHVGASLDEASEPVPQARRGPALLRVHALPLDRATAPERRERKQAPG
jgi:hypothetical protein